MDTIKTKKELLDERPVQPRFSMVGYILALIISFCIMIMGSIVLANGINYKINGETVEATIVEEDLEKHIIYVDYEYDHVPYQHKELKYWNEELDVNTKINIIVMKDNPEEFTTTNDFIGLSILIFGISFILIFIGVFEIVKFYKERNRIYSLLVNGEKQEAVIVACEQKNNRAIAGALAWEITASITDKVFNGCKNWIKFSLNGAVGYLVDIYIDKENENNFYIDLISIRKNENKTTKEENKYGE